MDLLCGVLDAIPCPTALLNASMLMAYANERSCPIPFGDLDFAALMEVQAARSGAGQPPRRKRLSVGSQSCYGMLEAYPVRTDDTLAGVLVLFHPEYAQGEITADSLPTGSILMEEVFGRVQRFALLASPVLIVGEKGTGKQDFAMAIHKAGLRRDKPFSVVNAMTKEEELLRLVKESGDGTLLCDRADLWEGPMFHILLSLLTDKQYTYPDGTVIQRNCRIMVTSLTDLPMNPDWVEPEERSDELPGTFREWFGFLLLNIPPLRDRKDDILPAAREYVQRFSIQENKEVRGFSSEAEEKLRNDPWPDNLIGLKTAILGAVRTCPGGLILPSHFVVASALSVGENASNLHELRASYSREQILALLAQYGSGVDAKKRAAKELGIGLSTLYRLIAAQE
jgi:DNA-binding NtrC family response regulator